MQYIIGGCDIPHMRNVLDQKFKKSGLKCKCMRCREIKLLKPKPSEYKVYTYPSSGGIEKYLTFEGLDNYTLYGFLRLRLVKNPHNQLEELEGCALIRELHVYGKLLLTDKNKKQKNPGLVQHKGMGKFLIKKAEGIAKANKFKKIAIISGIGTREYYRKLGYKLEGTYMIKELNDYTFILISIGICILAIIVYLIIM
jgi:elongator complex protein 3